MSQISKIRISGVTYDLAGSGGVTGATVIEVTQAQYDALVSGGTVDPTALYIITDAQSVDISNYWTSAQTQSAITQAVSGMVNTSAITSSVTSASTDSEIPTAKAVFDAIPTGGGGGGKAISAGTNISVTTGETADTINCTIPVSADTSSPFGVKTNYNGNTSSFMSFAGGYLTKAKMDYSFAFGMGAETNYYYSTAIGQYTTTTCWGETAFGRYNNSISATTNFDGNSGNTLFSVGNGTGVHARHNAFEIRQNGDIYLSLNGQDVKLQDQLGQGGGGSSYTAGDGIDITNNVISVTGKQDTLSAGTNITIVDNVISATGGGSTYSAGTNISITNDTINCTLPIVDWGSNNIAFTDKGYGNGNHTLSFGDGATTPSLYSMSLGNFTNARGNYSVAIGYGCRTNANFSNAFGYYTVTNNNKETAQGVYNNSVSATTTFGDSGNTLFSVGNGTADNARHNAFEIRQNGDIYITSGGTDIKLQDNLGGGGGSSYTAGDGIDITNNVISVTGKADTSAVTESINAAVSGKADTSAVTESINAAVSGKADTSAVTAIQDSLSGYVTTDTEQTISGKKIFTYTASNGKSIEFKQTKNDAKVGFRVINSASTNNELATFEFRPNTFTIDGVQHPLMYFGHYRNSNTANAGVPQTVIGFRQYDQRNNAAYHYLMPLPEKAKTPFSLTATSFKDYYAPMGFKNGSTMITADNTGVVDLSSELGGLKLVKLTQQEYDALTTKDSNTLYVIV